MKWLQSAFQNSFKRLYALLFPVYSNDAFDTKIHSQGRIVVFTLSQTGALISALILLFLYAAESALVAAVMGSFIAVIVLNCLLLRLGWFRFSSAALLFAAAAYGVHALLMLYSHLQPIIVYGFFPSVVGGFLFLGIRAGSMYALMFVALLGAHHILDETPQIGFFMQLCALVATFIIAFFYELASEHHINLLSVSLEKMTRLARTDQLTGILNRRAFFRQAGKRLKQNPQGAMLMIDLDDFKAINDTYGHGIGDMALKSLVQTIRSYIRETELFGRIGGEEFAVFLPVGLHDAYKRAETIRQAVSQIRFIRENVDLRLTISIGLTPLLESDTNVSGVLNRADKGLYRAKESGKNMTIVWSG